LCLNGGAGENARMSEGGYMLLCRNIELKCMAK
jgi:hypothetical protein